MLLLLSLFSFARFFSLHHAVELNRAQLEAWIPNLNSVNQIVLDSRNITSIDDFTFLNLPNVTWLYMSDNPLEMMGTNAFIGLENLTYFFMTKCGLTKLVFQHLTNLSGLTISNNRFRTIATSLFDE